jgi:hypothetical protein
MSDRDRYRALMLEHLYGLLEADEARELHAYLASPEGTGLRAEAEGWQDRIAGAARIEFPTVEFVPPAETAPVEAPVRPAGPKRLTIPSVWTQWAVAASLLIVVGGLGGPAAYQLFGWFATSRETNQARVALDDTRGRVARAELHQRSQRNDYLQKVERAAVERNSAEDALRQALAEARQAVNEKEFLVRLNGPDRAQPGAPNEWQIEALTRDGAVASAKRMEMVVRDDRNRELFRESRAVTHGKTALKLPASFWANVRPGARLFLDVAAQGDDDRRTLLARRIPLARPVFVTQLVTDKPMYRPGETIRFRSLTLDRATLLPPDKELHLQFRLRNADGAMIPLPEGNGRLLYKLEPVLGPDKKPLRGIGTGEYELEADAPPGEYTLEVVEAGTANETVLDAQKFQVAAYVVDRFEKKLEFAGKSYGAGDLVEARIEVRQAAGAVLKDPRADVTARVGEAAPFHAEKGVRLEMVPEPGAKEKKNAAARVRFRLPADLFANRANNDEPLNVTLSATVRDGTDAETIVRAIPAVEKGLNVEFYPEGGDLVEGVSGRVYFEVRTPDGKPADLKGFVTDGREPVAEVATLTDAEHPGVNRGQGVFAFTPKPGKKYFLVLRTPEGISPPTKDGYPLPAAKTDGIVLTALDPVTDQGGAIRVTVQSVKGPKTLHVGAYARGRLIAHERLEVAAGVPTEVKLAGDASIGGVTRVTVFEEPQGKSAEPADLIPRAERLVFRRPGEQLSVGARTDRDQYAPGDKVALELTATDETGKPKPAVLLVAVVNKSVLAMADRKTDRLLPTHFLLAGDVRNPAELENADFLLTDHPKAGTALDLLLGTQGWRRFAEQNVPPAMVFREEVERMLAAHGRKAGAPVTLYRMELERLTAMFLPRLEEAGLQVVDARNALNEFERTVEPFNQQQVDNARIQAEGAEKRHQTSAAELYEFQSRAGGVTSFALPALLIGLLGLACAGLVMLKHRPAGERRPVAIAILGSVAAAVLVFGAVVLTRATPEAARAAAIQKMEAGQTRNTGKAISSTMTPGPMVKKDRPDKKPTKGEHGRDGGPKAAIPDAPGLIRLAGPMPAVGATKGGRDVDAERVRQLVQLHAALPKLLIEPLPAVGPLPDPSLRPFIVREFAHRRETGQAQPEHTETVYWHPVLILPDSGRTTVEFQLADGVAGYQVLVAGHTVDGRIGAVTRTIEARPPTADAKPPGK